MRRVEPGDPTFAPPIRFWALSPRMIIPFPVMLPLPEKIRLAGDEPPVKLSVPSLINPPPPLNDPERIVSEPPGPMTTESIALIDNRPTVKAPSIVTAEFTGFAASTITSANQSFGTAAGVQRLESLHAPVPPSQTLCASIAPAADKLKTATATRIEAFTRERVDVGRMRQLMKVKRPLAIGGS